MQIQSDFDVVSLLYALAGVFTLYRLVQNRKSFFDNTLTYEDISLAWMVAIFLLTPIAVLTHELGHFFVAKHFGATGLELHHRGYWGFVTYQPGPAFDTGKKLIVSAAGPAVSVLSGFLSLALAVELPIRMVFKHTLAFFGVLSVAHALVGYPLIDLTSGLEGDFHAIYTLPSAPGKVVAGIVHGLFLGMLVLLWKRPPTRNLLGGYFRY